MSSKGRDRMVLLGIDIYNGTPPLDWPQARRQGVQFVIAKASQGWPDGPGGWHDWTWPDIVTHAKAAGIIPGGYHWALKGHGAAQAQHFVQSLKRAGGPHGFLCAVDIERNDWDQSLNVDPQTIDDFLTEWDRLTSKQPILLYGASWYHDGYLHAGARWPHRPLWWAGYTDVAGPIEHCGGAVTPGWMQPFGGWTSYTIRQFTSSATVGGVNVDGNVCYLTLPELQALTAPPTEEFTMDAQAKAAFAALTKTVTDNSQQLVTVIEGVPKGKPNPYGLIGIKDLAVRLDRIEAALARLAAK